MSCCCDWFHINNQTKTWKIQLVVAVPKKMCNNMLQHLKSQQKILVPMYNGNGGSKPKKIQKKFYKKRRKIVKKIAKKSLLRMGIENNCNNTQNVHHPFNSWLILFYLIMIFSVWYGRLWFWFIILSPVISNKVHTSCVFLKIVTAKYWLQKNAYLFFLILYYM